ncbi:sulfatase family protein [Hephaestia caeni]|uniref:sulfatase family protein n=1 Tax=Hephaestia caeni TaxID=645617 RepID=UPI0014742FA0|nr:sulfatase [Hephaestia caeni]
MTLTAGTLPAAVAAPAKRPNILIAISDDQSYPYASAYGSRFVRTPAFDRVAARGALFSHAFASSPGCSPSRAALLTGLNSWSTGAAGTHASNFPAIFTTIPERLAQERYHVGYTGKGWGPGRWQDERQNNPAGPVYDRIRLTPPSKAISPVDYAANFNAFLDARQGDAPFFFWYGAHEPHLPFTPGAGSVDTWRAGRTTVPPFLADTPAAHSTLADYAFEIEWFDRHLGRMLDELERRGELDNTIVIVTSDNGMPFPRAKANLYDSGLRVPLAIAWPGHVDSGRRLDQLVSLVDLAPTIYAAAGVAPPYRMAGVDLLPLLGGDGARAFKARDFVAAGRERHSSSRWHNLGYPARSLRTRDFLYIRNFHPERGPAGAPRALSDDNSPGQDHMAYFDIDRSGIQKDMFEHRDDATVRRLFDLAVAPRPPRELYDLRNDPDQQHNVADQPEYARIADEMDLKLIRYLVETGDPRVGRYPEQWEQYPRLEGVTRKFPPPLD